MQPFITDKELLRRCEWIICDNGQKLKIVKEKTLIACIFGIFTKLCIFGPISSLVMKYQNAWQK